MLNRRVRTRRRIVTSVGLAIIAAATATACIFDQGDDYKGGGRKGQGAEIVTAEPTTTEPTGEPTSTSDAASPIPEAGAGGG